MSKKADLEKSLKDLKEAEEKLIGKIGECMNLPPPVKAKFYDDVVPLLRKVVEDKLKTSTFPDRRELADIVFDKVMKSAFGEDVFLWLEKV